MSKPLNLTGSLYQVLDQNVHRYSSTSISGGGSDVNGNISNIQSSVSHHSDQEVWVKDLINDRERKFEFKTFNVDARPGHRLVVVWDKARDALERVINVDTETKYHANGFYNDWANSQASLYSPKFRFLNAIFLSLLLAVPVLGWIGGALMGLASLLTGNSLSSGRRLKHPINHLLGALILLLTAAHATVLMTVFSPAQSPLDFLYSNLVTQHWQVYPALLIHYLTIPGAFIFHLAADNVHRASGFTYWLAHTAGLGIQMAAVWWVHNTVNGKTLIRKSQEVDAYANEIKSQNAEQLQPQ